ncbi:MAG: hypothetical protein ACUVV3_04560 [Dehalococcoidia bacterium]
MTSEILDRLGDKDMESLHGLLDSDFRAACPVDSLPLERLDVQGTAHWDMVVGTPKIKGDAATVEVVGRHPEQDSGAALLHFRREGAGWRLYVPPPEGPSGDPCTHALLAVVRNIAQAAGVELR